MGDTTRVTTAQDLERLPLAERHRAAADAIVTDLDDVDPEFVERSRARGRALLEERGIPTHPA